MQTGQTKTTQTKDSDLIQQTLTLTSLSILKVDIDEGDRNYIDYLISFVLSVLQTNKPDVITDVVIADLLTKEFGLKIPIKAVQHVLRRIARDGYLRNENETFFPAEKLENSDLSILTISVMWLQNVFSGSMMRYAISPLQLKLTFAGPMLMPLTQLSDFWHALLL